MDDAVVVDPDRAENVITNDGTTMRIIAQTSAKPSAWTRQIEVVDDHRAETALIQSDVLAIEAAEAEGGTETPISSTYLYSSRVFLQDTIADTYL